MRLDRGASAFNLFLLRAFSYAFSTADPAPLFRQLSLKTLVAIVVDYHHIAVLRLARG